MAVCSHKDNEATQPAASQPHIQYPAADNEVTFPLATSLYKSGTNHNHDQPPHLRLRNSGIPSAVNLPLYAAPESRYCPAGDPAVSCFTMHLHYGPAGGA